MIMEKVFKVGTLLYEDRNRISKVMSDLRCFTSMLNKEIEKLIEDGYITADDVTNEIVAELSRFEASSVIKIVTERYKSEAEKTSYAPARNQFLKNLDTAIATIEDQVGKSKAQYEREQRSKGYYLDVQSRMAYFILSGHSVAIDEDKVVETHSVRIDNEAKAEIANKAYALVEEMKALSRQLFESQRFRKKIKLISRDDDSIIAIDKDGNVFLDKETLAFANIEEK